MVVFVVVVVVVYLCISAVNIFVIVVVVVYKCISFVNSRESSKSVIDREE